MTFLELIRRFRGLSQTELGKRADIQQSQVSQHEQRGLIPTETEAERLLSALDLEVGSVSPSVLVGHVSDDVELIVLRAHARVNTSAVVQAPESLQ